MCSCARIAALAVGFTLSVISALAADDGRTPVRVLWFPDNLGRRCPVDDVGVAQEVRRIFDRMGVDVDWTTVMEGEVENHGEVILVGLSSNPLPHPSILGSTNHDSMSAYVYCSAIAEALRIGRPEGRDLALLTRSVGRVAAHEIIHVVAPTFGHARVGLMQARWREATLRDDALAADGSTRAAVRARLSSVLSAGRASTGPGQTSDLARAGR
jgi:hypothetical protein